MKPKLIIYLLGVALAAINAVQAQSIAPDKRLCRAHL